MKSSLKNGHNLSFFSGFMQFSLFFFLYLLEKMSKKKTASSNNKEQGINHT